jgi:hypothetical protein
MAFHAAALLGCGRCARPCAMGKLWSGRGCPQAVLVCICDVGDMPSGAGVLVASRCPLSVHPSAPLSFFSFPFIVLTNFYLNRALTSAIPILEAKNAYTHSSSIACRPFQLYIVNIVRLFLLPTHLPPVIPLLLTLPLLYPSSPPSPCFSCPVTQTN